MSIYERRIRKEALSMCQSASWGMNGFQAAFPHLKDRFSF
jgi:hypothetical protein